MEHWADRLDEIAENVVTYIYSEVADHGIDWRLSHDLGLPFVNDRNVRWIAVRFTAFAKETTDVACRQLKRSDIGCIALKN